MSDSSLSRKVTRYLKQAPLSLVLSIPFLVLLITTVSVIWYLAFQNGQRSVEDMAMQLQSDITARVSQHLASFAAIPYSITANNEALIRQGLLDPTNQEMLVRHFWDQVQTYPTVTSIYFGNPSGGLASGGREGAEGQLYVIKTEDFRSGAFIKSATDSAGHPTEVLSTVSNFNATERPWYTRAVERGQACWSDIYILFTGQDLAIAHSRPVYDNAGALQGVLSIDIFITHIHDILHDIQVGENGLIFIVERPTGDNPPQLVASSTDDATFLVQGNQKSRFSPQEMQNPVIQATAQYVDTNLGGFGALHENYKGEFRFQNARYFLQAAPFQDGHGIDWIIVVVIPEMDFMTRIVASNRATAIGIALALCAAIIIAVLSVRWVTRPIQQLNTAAQSLARGEWGHPITLERNDEIGQLALSFSSMARQLRESFDTLEQQVEVRTAELRHTNQQLQQEIAERLRVEAELLTARDVAEAASRAKSDFLSSMSHELRTPLNGILGYAQVLKRDPQITEAQNRAVNIIYKSGEYLLTLINDVLDLSKIEAGKLELYPEVFNLGDFLDNIIGMIRVRAQQKSLALECKITPDLPIGVCADEKRLRQVLINLLDNAIKFTDHGHVTLRVNHLENTVPDTVRLRFEISDTGIGMDAEQLHHIFLPFEQVGDVRRRAEGSGLGLAISYRLVAAMGSHLQVESAPNHGSYFWFDVLLPMAELEADETFEAAESIIGYHTPRKERLTVLVVDDKATDRRLIADLLEPLGFTVLEASSGEACLANVQAMPPDIIIIDRILPGLNGLDVVEKLRSIPTLAQVVIIGMSAQVSPEGGPQFIAAGCDSFLHKPVRLRHLLHLFEAHLPLAWTYRPAEGALEPLASVKAEPVIAALPAAELQRLWDMLLRGNLRAIREHAQRLAQADARYQSLAIQLQHLTAEYAEQEIKELLEAYLKHSQVEGLDHAG